MSYYRDTFLKSEDWKNFRRYAILKHYGYCNLCGFRSKHNDVHHVEYKKLYDVKLSDVRVLCRKCHNWTHALLNKYPKLKTLRRSKLWNTIRAHYERPSRYADYQPSNGEKYRIAEKIEKFGLVKKSLKEAGLICRSRMPWTPDVQQRLKVEDIHFHKLIPAYMQITGRDPRRLVLDIRRTFPKP